MTVADAPTRKQPWGPRALTQAQWDALSPEGRARYLRELPYQIPISEREPLPGDRHRLCCEAVVGTLRAYFEAIGRVAYVTGEMTVYCPGMHQVSPDVFVVSGVEPGLRDGWVVTAEGKQPDWVLEVSVRGDRWKDLEGHLVDYAERGVREYFVADLPRKRLLAYRLNDPAIAVYTPILGQNGRFRSEVLGLDVALLSDRVRFYSGTARLLDPEEITLELRERLNDEQILRQEADERAREESQRAEAEAQRAEAEAQRAEAEAQRAEAEAQRAEAEAQRAVRAEEELARLRAELARLQR